MSRNETPSSKEKAAADREDRLKAALKANMARRKAQARARTGPMTAETTKQDEQKE